MSKVAIQGAATGTGVFTLASPATNTDRTLVLPDEAGTVLTTAGVPASAMPAGSVLQVVQFESTSSFITTSTSFTDATGFAASITPSSSTSKILVLLNAFISNAAANNYAWARVVRGGTVVISDLVQIEPYAFAGSGNVVSGAKLDLPNTTSQVTYQIQIRAESSGASARLGIGSGSMTTVGATSLVLMEIAA
jgi:hypothetical protein